MAGDRPTKTEPSSTEVEALLREIHRYLAYVSAVRRGTRLPPRRNGAGER